jgi:hypothetical protein
VLQGGLSILAVVGLERSGSGEPRPISTAGAAIELAIVLQNDLILVPRETGTLSKMMRNQTANFARPIFEFRIDVPTGVWRHDTTQRSSAASSLKHDEQGE